MDTTESREPDRQSFIQFPKSNEENRSNGERWHLLGTRVPQTEISTFVR